MLNEPRRRKEREAPNGYQRDGSFGWWQCNDDTEDPEELHHTDKYEEDETQDD